MRHCSCLTVSFFCRNEGCRATLTLTLGPSGWRAKEPGTRAKAHNHGPPASDSASRHNRALNPLIEAAASAKFAAGAKTDAVFRQLTLGFPDKKNNGTALPTRRQLKGLKVKLDKRAVSEQDLVAISYEFGPGGHNILLDVCLITAGSFNPTFALASADSLSNLVQYGSVVYIDGTFDIADLAMQVRTRKCCGALLYFASPRSVRAGHHAGGSSAWTRRAVRLLRVGQARPGDLRALLAIARARVGRRLVSQRSRHRFRARASARSRRGLP